MPPSPCQEGCPGTQHSDEAPKEDDLAAMLAEQVQPQFQFALIEADVASVTAQQAEPTFAAHPEPEIIAQDRPAGGCHDHQGNGQPVRRPSIDSSNQQHGLAREGNAHALDGDEEQDRPVAIGAQEM